MHPVLLQFGPLRLFSYGALIAVGGALSCRFWYVKRRHMDVAKEEDFWLLVNVILLGGFLGGRALFLVEYTRLFSREFWACVISLSQGFSVMGAFLGVTGGLWWFARRVGAPLAGVLDYVCQAAPVWHAFGRLGCFMAGCCFGKPTDLAWGVTFTDPRALIDAPLLGRPVHPTQLYEAFGDLLIAGFLYRFVLRAVEQSRKPSGTVAFYYFISYSILRFITEFFRGDTVPLPWLGLTAAQGICVLLGLTAFVAFLYNHRAWRYQCIRY